MSPQITSPYQLIYMLPNSLPTKQITILEDIYSGLLIAWVILSTQYIIMMATTTRLIQPPIKWVLRCYFPGDKTVGA